jgi:hypothetical protein
VVELFISIKTTNNIFRYQGIKVQDNPAIFRVWKFAEGESVGHVSLECEDEYLSVWPQEDIPKEFDLNALKAVPARTMECLQDDISGEEGREYYEVRVSRYDKTALKLQITAIKEAINSGHLKYCLPGKVYSEKFKGAEQCVNCVSSCLLTARAGGLLVEHSITFTPDQFLDHIGGMEDTKTTRIAKKPLDEVRENTDLKI